MGLQFRKTKRVLGYKEEKPEVYKIAQVTYPMVTFDQLVKECSISCGMNGSQTRGVIDALADRLVHYLELGFGVRVGKIGSFKPVFTSIVTQTLDDANANTIKTKKVTFFPGKNFRDLMTEMPVTAIGESYDVKD
ncbi:MAG: hypothetical protein KBT29_05470 [Prevotellaceae bacterium]|nr:hypothetical protein [Candidatus Minthosoma caballi]